MRNGRLEFFPAFFECEEFLREESTLTFHSLTGVEIKLPVMKNQFAFTVYQTPVVYHRGGKQQLVIHYADSEAVSRDVLRLNDEESHSLLSRQGKITRIDVQFNPVSWA